MTYRGLFLIKGAAKSAQMDSLHPVNRNEDGLIHFYPMASSKGPSSAVKPLEWIFLTPAEYQANQHELPPIVYASRNPIQWIRDNLDSQGKMNVTKCKLALYEDLMQIVNFNVPCGHQYEALLSFSREQPSAS